MTDLAVFTFSDIDVRTVVIDDEPWFVAADVCTILDFRMASDALRLLDDDEKGYAVVRTPGGDQRMSIVNESGLYALIFRSRTDGAKTFRKWVTDEVIPAIRKTGRYEAPVAPVALPDRRALALMVIEAEDRADRAEAELATVAPKAQAWDHLASAIGDYAVADAAKMLSRHPLIKVGQQRLFTLLGRMGWAYRRQLDNRWTVYQSAVECGWLTELASSHYHPRTGELVLDAPQVRVTAKGLGELHHRLSGGVQTAIAS
jgi:prophage antirepressor-like protein